MKGYLLDTDIVVFIQDFDLLIGCTSVVEDLVMVTNNVKHFSRIENIKIDNWVR